VRSEKEEMVRDVVLNVNCVEGTEGVERAKVVKVK
jgi:hypothetical protein